jgi:phosphate uptake regulator
MERKLVKQGRNALTVTLPAKWLQAKGLAAGDSVFIEEQNRQLVVRTTMAAGKTSVELDLTGCERSMMAVAVIAKYLDGYDTIAIRHSCPKVAQEMTQWFIGMVVEEQTQNRLVLKSIVSVPEDNFDVLLRRAGHMLLEQARTIERITRGKATPDDCKAQEKLLDRNILYCLRYLNKYENHQHAYRYFLTLSTMELAADQISRISRHIGRQAALAQAIVKGMEDYTRLLFTNDLKKMYAALRQFRNSIGTRSFADGLAFSLAEILYNYIGYIVETDSLTAGA